MKTRITLGLSLCCLMFCLGGLIMTHVGQAQARLDPCPLPQKKIETIFIECPPSATPWDIPGGGGTFTEFIEVPSNKRFIVTDIAPCESTRANRTT